jgi:manganese oxidase
VRDSLVVLPGAAGDVAFTVRRAGTSLYWGVASSARRRLAERLWPAGLVRPGFDSQLAGAFVVDSAGPVPDDRVFVITELFHRALVDSATVLVERDRHGIPVGEITALNGRSWPHTERLRYALGDSIRWRVVNATFQPHPMHLHGFYFRVDAHGAPRAEGDSVYAPAQRRMAVTEVVGIGETAAIVWSPDRPGGWVFHCHLAHHVAKLPPLDRWAPPRSRRRITTATPTGTPRRG